MQFRVETIHGIETDAFPITLVPITVIGWKAGNKIPKANEDQTLTVRGLPRFAGLPAANRGPVRVTLGGMTREGTITAENEVIFTVPPAKPDADGQVEVTVEYQGRTSAAAKVPLDT